MAIRLGGVDQSRIPRDEPSGESERETSFATRFPLLGLAPALRLNPVHDYVLGGILLSIMAVLTLGATNNLPSPLSGICGHR
jgi:hypothetical protein